MLLQTLVSGFQLIHQQAGIVSLETPSVTTGSTTSSTTDAVDSVVKLKFNYHL